VDRLELLERVLAGVAHQDVGAATDRAEAAVDDGDPAMAAVAAFAAFWAGNHDRAVELLRVEPADADACAIHTVVRGLVAAAVGERILGDPFAGMAEVVAPYATDDRWGAFVRYAAVEGAMADARLSLAMELMPPGRPPYVVWAGHPYAGVMVACRARLDAFSGRIADAARAFADAPREGAVGALLYATEALVAGNAADPETLDRCVGMVESADLPTLDHLGRGVFLLVAFGAIAHGDTALATRCVIRAGGDAAMTPLTIIDRLLSYELLVSVAVDAGDLDAARAWQQLAEHLDGERAAMPTLWRIRSRVRLLGGDPPGAEEAAQRAVELARCEGRAVEAAEAEIVLARARIAGTKVAEATRDLREAVVEGDRTGHRAVRRSASRTLRTAGRRLPPVLGGGWESLSRREAEIAELMIAGGTNEAIASRLHLSVATVRVHASRVLAAFGAASRIGLLAAVNDWPGSPVVPSDLTPRQADIVERIAQGWSNQRIADDLGISVKAVENHVGEVLRRWGLEQRFAVALEWWSRQS